MAGLPTSSQCVCSRQLGSLRVVSVRPRERRRDWRRVVAVSTREPNLLLGPTLSIPRAVVTVMQSVLTTQGFSHDPSLPGDGSPSRTQRSRAQVRRGSGPVEADFERRLPV